MRSVLRKAGLHCNCMVFSKGVQLLVFADNINIVGHTKRVTAAFIYLPAVDRTNKRKMAVDK